MCGAICDVGTCERCVWVKEGERKMVCRATHVGERGRKREEAGAALLNALREPFIHRAVD